MGRGPCRDHGVRGVARITPGAAINRLHQAIAKSVAIPEVKERVTALGADLAASSPEEFAAFVKKEIATWSGVVKEVGIRVE